MESSITKPFYSGEIRWFSKERDVLFNIYKNMPGTSKLDSERTDYYLKIISDNTGVKLREGKHEIKTKLASETTELGILETWSKWSYKQADLSILAIVNKDLQQDWIKVGKKRWKKKYEILKGAEVKFNNGHLQDGCGVEFTEIKVEDSTYYTLGFESFAFLDDQGNQDLNKVLLNLKAVIQHIGLSQDQIKNIECASYPSFLTKWKNE